jgi:hypothetical protein
LKAGQVDLLDLGEQDHRDLFPARTPDPLLLDFYEVR